MKLLPRIHGQDRLQFVLPFILFLFLIHIYLTSSAKPANSRGYLSLEIKICKLNFIVDFISKNFIFLVSQNRYYPENESSSNGLTVRKKRDLGISAGLVVAWFLTPSIIFIYYIILIFIYEK